jgi:hypothetical protein
MSFITGLDLGKSADYTAVCVLESNDQADAVYKMHSLDRFPLNTSYTKIVQQVASWFKLPHMKGSILAVDATGVGRPVVDLFRLYKDPQWDLRPITITAGHSVTQLDDSQGVPKKDLVSSLSLLFESGRLKVPKKLKLLATLKKELQSFSYKITKSANEVFEAREGANDDCVLAASLAAWVGENSFTGAWDVTPAKGQLADWTKAPPGVWNDPRDFGPTSALDDRARNENDDPFPDN